MKPILLTAPVEIEVDAIAQALTPEELGSLISDLANHIAVDHDSHRRRKIAGEMMSGLSENALGLLADCVALGYQNSKVWAKTDSRKIGEHAPKI